MGGLSQDLNSYLSKSNNGSSNSLSSLTSKLSSMSLPTLNSMKSPFGSGGGDDEEPFLGVASDKGMANNRKEDQSWIARKLEENLPSLSKKQRIIGFMTSLLLGTEIHCWMQKNPSLLTSHPHSLFVYVAGTICFGLAVSFLPLLLINPRKFSLLFTLGSVFTLSRYHPSLLIMYRHIRTIVSASRFCGDRTVT